VTARRALARFTRRNRRLLAAALAGASVLAALASLNSTPAASAPEAAGPTASPGGVLVPVTLAPAGVASALRVGDTVDLLATAAEDGSAGAVAEGARVVSLPTAGSAFGASSSGVVLVSVDALDAMGLAAAAAQSALAVVVHR
jgi:hypothetical protein